MMPRQVPRAAVGGVMRRPWAPIGDCVAQWRATASPWRYDAAASGLRQPASVRAAAILRYELRVPMRVPAASQPGCRLPGCRRGPEDVCAAGWDQAGGHAIHRLVEESTALPVLRRITKRCTTGGKRCRSSGYPSIAVLSIKPGSTRWHISGRHRRGSAMSRGRALPPRISAQPRLCELRELRHDQIGHGQYD